MSWLRKIFGGGSSVDSFSNDTKKIASMQADFKKNFGQIQSLIQARLRKMPQLPNQRLGFIVDKGKEDWDFVKKEFRIKTPDTLSGDKKITILENVKPHYIKINFYYVREPIGSPKLKNNVYLWFFPHRNEHTNNLCYVIIPGWQKGSRLLFKVDRGKQAYFVETPLEAIDAHELRLQSYLGDFLKMARENYPK